jgi:tRNA dimethylallyltransferase
LINRLNQKIYFICGPTAIGKSSLAIRLAKKLNGIIINADSMQVYSNIRILSARPSQSDCYKIRHKLYGYVDGSLRYNVASWCNDVIKVIKENEKTQTPSVIVGGTGMYIGSLLNGLIDMPQIPEQYKKDSEELFNKVGLENFIKIIAEFDNFALKDISKNDSSRTRRIWEVFKSTGITYTEWKTKKNKNFLNNFSFNLLFFNPQRDEIYNNINLRFTKMIKEGAIEEVKKLLELDLDRSLPIMRAHGVPEISSFLLNKINLEECIEKGQQITRNYAKRQLTWWRSSTLPIHQVFNHFPNEIDENLIKI